MDQEERERYFAEILGFVRKTPEELLTCSLGAITRLAQQEQCQVVRLSAESMQKAVAVVHDMQRDIRSQLIRGQFKEAIWRVKAALWDIHMLSQNNRGSPTVELDSLKQVATVLLVDFDALLKSEER